MLTKPLVKNCLDRSENIREEFKGQTCWQITCLHLEVNEGLRDPHIRPPGTCLKKNYHSAPIYRNQQRPPVITFSASRKLTMPSLKLKISAPPTQQDDDEEVSVSTPPSSFAVWTFEEVDLLIRLCKENKTLLYDDISQLFNAATMGQQRTEADIRYKLSYKPRNDLRSSDTSRSAPPKEEEADEDEDYDSEAEEEPQPSVGVGKWSAKDEKLVMRLFAENRDLSYTKVTELFNAQTTGPQRTTGSVRQKFLYGKKKQPGRSKVQARGTKPKKSSKPSKSASIPRKPKEAGDGKVIGHDASGKPIAAVVVDGKTIGYGAAAASGVLPAKPGRPKKRSAAGVDRGSEEEGEDRPSSSSKCPIPSLISVLTSRCPEVNESATESRAVKQPPEERSKIRDLEETQEGKLPILCTLSLCMLIRYQQERPEDVLHKRTSQAGRHMRPPRTRTMMRRMITTRAETVTTRSQGRTIQTRNRASRRIMIALWRRWHGGICSL